MGSAMRIDLAFGGIAAGARDAGRLADSIERAARASEAIAPSAGGGGGGRGVGGSVSQRLRFVGGPNQRLMQIAEQRTKLDQIADPALRAAVEKDLAVQEFRAKRSLALHERATKRGVDAPGLLELLGKVAGGRSGGVLKSLGGILGGGGGAAAGAGGVAGALGSVAAMAGPVGLVVAGLELAKLTVDAFIDGLKASVAELTTFRENLNRTGGTQSDVAQLTAFGLGSQAGGLAANLRQRLATDPMAMAFGARLGLGPRVAGPFGKVNEADDLVKAIEGLRRISNRDERIRIARATGTEDLLKIADVSEGVFSQMKEDAITLGKVMDPKGAQAAVDLAAQWGRAQQMFKAGLTAFFKPIMPVLSAVIGNITNYMRTAISNWESGPGKVVNALGRFFGTIIRFGDKVAGLVAKNPLVERLFKVIEFIWDSIAKVIDTATDALNKALGVDAKGRDNAVDAHTRAMQRHTDALNRSGTFGGGDRARAALGASGLGVGARTRAIEMGALNLGFWPL